MVTELEISLGGGHATVNLDLSWRQSATAGRRVGLLALLLATPMALLLGAQVVGAVTGRYNLDQLLGAPRGPWVYLLAGGTMAVVLALIVVLVTQLRVAVGSQEGVRRFAVTLRLTALEALSVVLAGGFVALFVVHLVADGLACARGVVQAC